MKKMISLLLLVPYSALAATMIETVDEEGGLARIYIEGNLARFEMPSENGYAVMDTDKRTMKAVIPQQKMVMDMSDMMRNNTGKSARSGNMTVKDKGKGPKIAGYSTQEYTLHAGSKYCGSAYVSKAVLNDLQLDKFFDAMQAIGDSAGGDMAGLDTMTGGKSDPCLQAEENASEEFKKIGFPLRVTNANKKIVSEVRNISKNARLPPGAFDIPADYPVTNPAQMMRDAMKQMPPEAMEMMRQQMQQMYQQQ